MEACKTADQGVRRSFAIKNKNPEYKVRVFYLKDIKSGNFLEEAVKLSINTVNNYAEVF